MEEKILNLERVHQEYDSMTKQIIETVESLCFDIQMEKLLKGMLNLDWVMVSIACYSLRVSLYYIYIDSFTKPVGIQSIISKIFVKLIKSQVMIKSVMLGNSILWLMILMMKNNCKLLIIYFLSLKKLEYQNLNFLNSTFLKQLNIKLFYFRQFNNLLFDCNLFLAEENKIRILQRNLQEKIRQNNLQQKRKLDTIDLQPRDFVMDQPQRETACCEKCVIF